MRYAYAVDEWIIEQLERFSHFTQRLAGITAVTWERLMLVVSIACVIQLMIIETRWGWAVDILIILFRLARFYATYQHNESREFLNIKKLTERRERIVFVIMSAVFITSYCVTTTILHHGYNVWFESMTLSMYFRACNILPPSESRSLWRVRRLTMATESA